MLTLKVDVEPGTSITYAVTKGCELVNLTKCRVRFTFNGINCLVKSKYLDEETILEKYHTHINNKIKYSLIF